MTHLQRRLNKLEALLTDFSGLVPYSDKWMEYWDRQHYLFLTGQDRNAIQHSSIEVFRAVMRYAEENPASLVASIPDLAD
jgi:hypothetical protein